MTSKPSNEAPEGVHARLRNVTKNSSPAHREPRREGNCARWDRSISIAPGGIFRHRWTFRVRQVDVAGTDGRARDHDAGTIEFGGKPVEGTVPDGVGVVFQEDASIPWLTVADNIAFGLRRIAITASERKKRVKAALAMMGLTEFAASYPAHCRAACASASALRAPW